MMSKSLKYTLLVLMLGAAGCSEPQEAPKAYVTNADYVLERIEVAKTSGIAFQVKPVRSTACKYMYLEVGKKNAEGRWVTTNSVYPGKDPRNNFGESDLENQVHFIEVDGFGEFGVLALGCAPYGGEMKVSKGFLGSFDVDYGKLNYIGELALIPIGSGRFSKFEVADRSDFALDKIRTNLPDLEKYFQSNVAEKYEPELTAKQKASLAEAAKIRRQSEKNVKNANKTIEARNIVSGKLRKANDVLDAWDAANGYPQKDMSDAQYAERKVLIRKSGRLSIKISRYDAWIERNIPYALTQEYMKLEDAAERANKNYQNKYPLSKSISEIKVNLKDPEYVRLSDLSREADKALSDFEELHDL